MRKIEHKTQQSNRKHTFVASMAIERTAATAKAMSTTTDIARTSVATAATSTAAANSQERQRDVSKIGQQTQQSDRVYLRDLQLRRPYLVRTPTANHRPAASAAAALAWDGQQAGTGGM